MIFLSLNLRFISLLYLFYLNQLTAIPISDTKSELKIFPKMCDSLNNSLCIPIKSCRILLKSLNETQLLARRCGPSNENKKNPHVCCEKNLVFIEDATILTDMTPEVETTTEILFRNESNRCGFQLNSRILGGLPSQNKEYPWMARLLHRDYLGNTVFICTGSLISARVVLTAAHCIFTNDNIGDLYAVSFGDHATDCLPRELECFSNKQVVIVSESVIHPEYSSTSKNHDNDLALVILRDQVKFTDNISPICLQENRLESNEYYVAGWGITEDGTTSNVKLKATLPTFSWSQCVKKYQLINVNITERQVCAGGLKNVDSCQGDSGGPLMVRNNNRWYVTGVISFGIGCAKPGWPSVNVYIPSYVKWINSIIRQKTS